MIDQVPSFAEERFEAPVVNLAEFGADPSGHTHIGRPVEDGGLIGDHEFLYSGGSGNPDRDVAIIVMIIGTHGKHAFAQEECWFSVRQLFRSFGQGETNAPDSFDHAVILTDFGSGINSSSRRITAFGWQVRGTRCH